MDCKSPWSAPRNEGARKTKEVLTFELGLGERIVLQKILRQYPLTPLSHHKITRSAKKGSGLEISRCSRRPWLPPTGVA